MTERDQLRALATDMEHTLRLWPLFAAAERADGFPRSTPGSGSVGRSSDISDPTAHAAMQRAPHTNAEQTACRELATLAELACALWHALRDPGLAPPQRCAPPHPITDAERARIAAQSCATHWAKQRPEGVGIWDGLELIHEHTADVLSAIDSHRAALRRAMRLPAVDTTQAASRARCHGGGLEPWARPECERLAVTLDGLCHACDRRRRRHEAGEQAA